MKIADYQILVSGILRKEDRKFARVSFIKGEAFAEFIVPDKILDQSKNVPADELKEMEEYISDHFDELFSEAAKVNPLKKWLGIGEDMH